MLETGPEDRARARLSALGVPLGYLARHLLHIAPWWFPVVEGENFEPSVFRNEVAERRFLEAVPFSGRILSRSHEPSVGWSGVLREVRSNALVFESEPGCRPLVPAPLPAFCLLSPEAPNLPGAAQVSWTPADPALATSLSAPLPFPRWLPSVLRVLLRPEARLEHALLSGLSVWRIAGIATLFELAGAARPRLVLAPPSRRGLSNARRAILNSLDRAFRSMPPQNDLQTLVRISRELLVAADRGPSEFLRRSESVKLVGFGSGQTACGDDYLAGFFCGLDLRSSVDPGIAAGRFHEFRGKFVRSLRPSLDETTLLGRHVLEAAFQGLYSAPLLEEADALSDGIIIGPGEPEWSLVRRPTVSPGWAALLGLLTGAQATILPPN